MYRKPYAEQSSQSLASSPVILVNLRIHRPERDVHLSAAVFVGWGSGGWLASGHLHIILPGCRM